MSYLLFYYYKSYKNNNYKLVSRIPISSGEKNEPIFKMYSIVRCTYTTKVLNRLIKLILTSISLLTLTFSSAFLRFSAALYFSSEKRRFLEKETKANR